MSDDVSNDLMVDIFERLPLKSIIRFRSLSKYWHSRIATPEFIRNHSLRCSKNPPKLLIKHHTYCGNLEFKDIYTLHPVDQLPLDSSSGYIRIPGVEFPHGSKEVIGSCNGILCLRSNGSYISLWNLSIRRELIVPRVPCLTLSSKALGFGFDPITDDYNLVAICYNKYGSDGINAFVYSLKKDSWIATPSPSTRLYNVKSNACFFNGILHWVVDGYLTEPSPEERKHPIRFIFTFDLNTHVCGHILLPGPWRVEQLTTINGCLVAVSLERGNIWKIRVMKEYCNIESWSVLFEFQADAFDVIRVFQAVTNGDIVAYYNGSSVYNLQTRLLMKLLKFGPYCFDVEMETYAESLELLDKERATTCGETIFSWTKEDDRKRIRLSQGLDDECLVLNYTF
ncbi:putative F-box domain-containing protein [Helianthus anomalus]